MKSITTTTPFEIYWQTPNRQWFRGEVLSIENDLLLVVRLSPSRSQCTLQWADVDPFERQRIRKHFNLSE